jgi:pimeloyl-ACP methyl ester carboxylesterase
MSPVWKRKPVWGVGIGVGLLGAVALALRHRNRLSTRGPIPKDISPTIFATRVANTSRGDVVYHVCGSGTPLVFLHGLFPGASSYEWSKVYCHFAMDREVLAPDLIGFGESTRPANALDAREHVECLAEFLRAACPGRPAILAASGLTCQIALLLAARHPELVERLVLFLPSRLREPHQADALGLPLASRIPGIRRFLYNRRIARPAFIRAWLASAGYADPAALTDETVEVLSSFASQYGAEHAILALMKNRKSFDASSRLEDILAPVHILWPGKAEGFPPGEATALCRRLPKSSLEILGEESLFAPMEAPARITRTIAHWLDGDLAGNAAAG